MLLPPKNLAKSSRNVQQSAKMCNQGSHEGSTPSTRSPSTIVENVERNGALASEGGHWYLPDGTPFYTVPYAASNKEKAGQMRAVTIKDARKVSAVPSVTTVLGSWNAKALNTWKEKCVHEAIIDMLIAGRNLVAEDAQDRDKLWAEVQERAALPTAKAADRGTSAHAAIEGYLTGQPYDADFQEHIEKIRDSFLLKDITLRCGAAERSFACSMGFGGKVDYHVRDHGLMKDGLVIDFKTKPNKDKIEKAARHAGLGWRAQLAAYRIGLGIPSARCFSTLIGVEDCSVVILEWTQSDLTSAWQFFAHILGAWKIDNTYWPKI